MPSEIKKLFLTVIISILFIGCNGGKMEEQKIHNNVLENIPASTWEKLAQKKIFFGHQSVGNNILDGIRDLMKENPRIKLNIIETSNPADFDAPLFAHARVGKNRDPRSKIDAFTRLMEEGIGGNRADIAFFKFCYVDFGASANIDIKDVFGYYKKSMSKLRNKYPKKNFVHFTVPLETSKIPFKFWLKIFKSTGWSYRLKMIKNIKNIWRYDANIKRNEFNELIRREYAGKEPVFDLAKIESTHPDGKRETFTKHGKRYYSLVPDYTHDGGHLNELGRKIAAEQLLLLLANISK